MQSNYSSSSNSDATIYGNLAVAEATMGKVVSNSVGMAMVRLLQTYPAAGAPNGYGRLLRLDETAPEPTQVDSALLILQIKSGVSTVYWQTPQEMVRQELDISSLGDAIAMLPNPGEYSRNTKLLLAITSICGCPPLDYYLASIQGLLEASPADLLKPGEAINPENVALVKKTWVGLIENFITHADEPLSRLDVVTLYLPNASGIFEEKQRVLPLKLALSLWVAANLDDAQFAENPSSLLEVAEKYADRPARLQSLFECLKRVKKGICHQGIRHEIIMLLNGTYKGINIIVDASVTVQSAVRDRVYAAFNRWMATKENLENVRKAFFTWMRDSNVLPLLEYLGGNDVLRQDLRQLFIAHGSNPETLIPRQSFEPFFERQCSELPFTYTPAHQVLGFIYEIIFNPMVIMHDQPERNEALATMEVWLQNDYQFEPEHDARISNFRHVVIIHQELHQYQNVLQLSGKMTSEDLEQHNAWCRHYFTRNSDFNVEDNQTIKVLQAIIAKCKEDACAEFVQNFFVHWFLAKRDDNLTTLKSLYSSLLADKMVSKITVTFDVIRNFTRYNSGRAEGFRDITPYEINRIFLHAIIHDPAIWNRTEGFAALFKEILDFVIKPAQRVDLRAEWLTRDSYPNVLIAQLKYLYEVFEFKSLKRMTAPERPIMRDTVLLPAYIENIEEWIAISISILSDQQRLAYYQMHEYW